MSSFLLCVVEDVFLITGRGLVIIPVFPTSKYHFDLKQKVRITPPNADSFDCNVYFQVPFLSPPPEIVSYCCTLLDVSKENVPIGSQIWLLEKNENEIRLN